MPKIIQTITSGDIQLSANFYLSEFVATRQPIENVPDPLAVQNLFKTAELMQKVRKLLGDKIISISSGYRCQKLNKAVGGSLTSDHMRGEACDFVCRAFGTPLQVASAIAKSDIKFGQLIQEGSWVHISLPTRENNGEILTATLGSGKTTYRKGL